MSAERIVAREQFLGDVPAAGLYMLRLHLSAPRLMEHGRRRQLPLRHVDDGYLVHSALGELFGASAPTPFALASTRGRSVEVLAYSDQSAGDLREYAAAFADPAVHSICDWSRFHAKPMPASWHKHWRLGFAVRVCPVVRASGDGARRRKGAEVDAFLARTERAQQEDSVTRESVYKDWFSSEIERRGGARILSCGLVAFRLGRLLRRTQGHKRRATVSGRPDASLRGELEVTDGERFAALLRRGVGRHRAFGFGMVLLRPAGD